MSSQFSDLPQLQQGKVSPFCLSDEEISILMTATHSSGAVDFEVDHLYNIVSNMIKKVNSCHIIDKCLELKVKPYSSCHPPKRKKENIIVNLIDLLFLQITCELFTFSC